MDAAQKLVAVSEKEICPKIGDLLVILLDNEYPAAPFKEKSKTRFLGAWYSYLSTFWCFLCIL